MNQEKIRVLIAEDEIDIRDTIAEILRDENFEVYEANNGKEGFEIFDKVKPHVIISDIMMPEIDGYGFLKLVRESKSKNNMAPFIFLSALGQKENIIKGVNLSANDYLVKPIDFEILIAKVQEKAQSSLKFHKFHEKGISNIKSQISSALPSEITSYLDPIIQISQMLKEQPYGPLPHRRYLEDINRIYSSSLKLKSTIVNSLDQNVIENRLNADEEIFSLPNFIEKAVNNLPNKIKDKVEFEKPYESDLLPKIKIDKTILIDIIKTAIAGAIKASGDSSIRISLVLDSLNQLVIIFYIISDSGIEEIKNNIDIKKIEECSNLQNLEFRIIEKIDLSLVITIPSFRLIN